MEGDSLASFDDLPPEIVAKIFGYLITESNLTPLLRARLVWSEWKHIAFLVLKKKQCLSLLPSIVDGKNLLRDADRQRDKLLSTFTKTLSGPFFDLPLQIIISQWKPHTRNFLSENADLIVSFTIATDDFSEFPVDFGIELPKLENAQFSGFSIGHNEINCADFAKTLAAWKNLVGTSEYEKLTCKIELNMSENNSKDPDDSAFDPVQWKNVTYLTCSNSFLQKLLTRRELPGLRGLKIFSSGISQEMPISLEKASLLKELTLACKGEYILPQMDALTMLEVEDGVIINGTKAMSTLLPNLSKLVVTDHSVDSGIFSTWIHQGAVFQNVSKLNMTESWNLNEGVNERARQIFHCFPKLAELSWMSSDNDQNTTNKSCFKAGSVIFSILEHLKHLNLTVPFATEHDVFEALTGISMQNIHIDEDTWPSQLSSTSVCSLKHLEKLVMNISGQRSTTLGLIPTRFLFKAAFQTMNSLQHLDFAGINFTGHVCIRRWREIIGRTINVMTVSDRDEIDSSDSDCSDSSNDFSLSESEWLPDDYPRDEF